VAAEAHAVANASSMEKDRGSQRNEMESQWQNIFANWATDRSHSVTAATRRLLGTPGYVVAKADFKAGASEKVVRSRLDQADTMNKDAGD